MQSMGWFFSWLIVTEDTEIAMVTIIKIIAPNLPQFLNNKYSGFPKFRGFIIDLR